MIPPTIHTHGSAYHVLVVLEVDVVVDEVVVAALSCAHVTALKKANNTLVNKDL